MQWWKDPQALLTAMANLVDKPTGGAGTKGGGKGAPGGGKGGGKGGKPQGKGGAGKGAKGSSNAAAWQGGSGKRWWDCNDPNCTSVLKKSGRTPRKNSPSSMECDICGTHWDSARQMQDLKTEALKKEVKEVKQAQKAQATVDLTDDSTIQVAVPKEQEEIWMGTDDEAPPSTVQLALTQEYTATAARLSDPRELKEPLTPAQALAVHRPGKSPPDLGRLQEELADQQAYLTLQAKKIAGGESDATKKKIEQLTKQIEKLEHSTDGAAVAAAEWELALKNYNRAETNRVARTDAATLRAEEHSDRLEEICSEQMAAWEAHLVTLKSQRSVRVTAWEARRLLLENQALAVVSLAEQKIMEANSRAGSPPAQQTPSPQLQLEEVVKLKEAARVAEQEKAELMKRLEALETKLAQPAVVPPTPQPTPPTLTQSAAQQCNRTIMYGMDELPVLKDSPENGYKKKLILIATNLAHWGRAGQVPLTYQQLLSGTEGAELEEAFQIIKDLAGELIWKRMYSTANISIDQLVPFQMGNILKDSLMKAEKAMLEFAKLADYNALAAARFKELHEQDQEAKRRRCGLYAAS